MTALGLVIALAASTIAVVSVVSRGDAATEVHLESKGSHGTHPFTQDVSATNATPTATYWPGTTARPVSGDAPGLYGGTQDNAACDADQLVKFLAAEPAKATAWAGVLGIRAAQISDYAAKLVPVILRADTRVTNHGFSDGRATSLQSVLQAGTAVFVDSRGVPRVRCSCGNPLTDPVQVNAEYSGAQWPKFSSQRLMTVAPAKRSAPLVVTDDEHGTTYKADPTARTPVITYVHLQPPSPDPGGTIDVTYPILGGGSFVAANAQARATAQSIVDDYLANDDHGAGFGDCSDSPGGLSGTVAATLVRPDYVSFLWKLSSHYPCGNSDNPDAKSVTFDVKTGKSIDLASLFTAPTWRQDLWQAGMAALRASDSAEPDFYNEAFSDTGDDFTKYASWSLAPDGLMLTWGGGIVADEATGPVSVTIPWSALDADLSELGHVAAFNPKPATAPVRAAQATPEAVLKEFAAAVAANDEPRAAKIQAPGHRPTAFATWRAKHDGPPIPYTETTDVCDVTDSVATCPLTQASPSPTLYLERDDAGWDTVAVQESEDFSPVLAPSGTMLCVADRATDLRVAPGRDRPNLVTLAPGDCSLQAVDDDNHDGSDRSQDAAGRSWRAIEVGPWTGWVEVSRLEP